jgi:tetratricopeptide (TPR) repeat protein
MAKEPSEEVNEASGLTEGKKLRVISEGITPVKAMILIVCVALFALFRPSLASAQDNPVELFDKGKALLGGGNYDQAIEVFSKAIGMLDPAQRNAQVLLLARAKAYLSQGDWKNALKDVTRIIQTERIDGEILASALQLRSRVNLCRGREKEALEDLTKAIKVPEVSIPLRSLCYAYRGATRTDVGDTEGGLSDLRQAIELDPKSAFAYAERAKAYLRKDNIQEAKLDSEHALRLNPDEQTRKIVDKVLQELAVSASGPSRASVLMRADGHILVNVSFSKKGKSHLFLLDTGATYSLIDRDLLDEISRETQVKQIGRGMAGTADGAFHKVTHYKVKTAFLENLPLGEIEVHVFDKKGKRIINLLGAQSLRNVSVSIDNHARKVEITRKD